MNSINFKLKGLTCEACIKLAAGRIKKIPGVQDVKISPETGDAKVVSIADINLDIIKKSLAGTNYNISQTI